MKTQLYPITVEVLGEIIILSQQNPGEPEMKIRLSAEQIDAVCDLMYFARKSIEQMINERERAAEVEAIGFVKKPAEEWVEVPQ